MSWLPWAISGMGAVFLVVAGVGYCTRPDGPADAVRIHRVYRVLLPLVIGWVCFVGWFPQALDAPWLVADICRLIALAPAIVFFAARRRACWPPNCSSRQG
ncbi:MULTISPECIES: hypothetical protein [unclassified Streptomyces]|uniref:hypothetical protein n=1 Tax=Streptomyces sp. NPDC127532 TaxID=3345399 RepID=UPI0036307659